MFQYLQKTEEKNPLTILIALRIFNCFLSKIKDHKWILNPIGLDNRCRYIEEGW